MVSSLYHTAMNIAPRLTQTALVLTLLFIYVVAVELSLRFVCRVLGAPKPPFLEAGWIALFACSAFSNILVAIEAPGWAYFLSFSLISSLVYQAKMNLEFFPAAVIAVCQITFLAVGLGTFMGLYYYTGMVIELPWL